MTIYLKKNTIMVTTLKQHKLESAKSTIDPEAIYLQPLNYSGHRIRHQDYRAKISELESELDLQDGAWKIVPGLQDPSCISFESTNYPGYYLRHRNFEVWLDIDDGSPLFKIDATFRIMPGLANEDRISFESYNYSGYYIRHTGFVLYIQKSDGSELFKLDSTFTKSLAGKEAKTTKRLINLCLNGKLDQMLCSKKFRCLISSLETEADQIEGIWKIVPGLASSEHVSFESYANPGYYLRHRYNELWIDQITGLEHNKQDATFKMIPGLDDNLLVSFESLNFPGHYIRSQEGVLFLHSPLSYPGFNPETTFKVMDAVLPFQIVTINSLNCPKFSVRNCNTRGRIAVIDDEEGMGESTWKIVPGLADPKWISFESVNYPGYYLRHRGFQIWLDRLDGSDIYKKDATFRKIPGLENNECISFESYNYPGHYIRHSGYELFIQTSDGTEIFRNDATFLLKDSGTIEENFEEVAIAVFLQSLNYPNYFIHNNQMRAAISELKKSSALQNLAWKIVPGLADSSWISFESVNFPGYFLRHRNFEIWLDPFTDQDLYKKDATFKARPGLANNQWKWVSYESYNYPQYYIRHCGYVLHIHKSDGSDLFKKDATFLIQNSDDVKSIQDGCKLMSIQSLNYPTFNIRHDNGRAGISQIDGESATNDSTWRVVPGLADSNLVSFESVNSPGHHLRHRNFEFWVDEFEDSDLYCKDATFKVVPGLYENGSDWISFEALNFPGYYIRHCNFQLYLHKMEKEELYQKDSTWKMLN